MKNRKILIVGLIGLLMGVALITMGCLDFLSAVGSTSDSYYGKSSCYGKNGCYVEHPKCGRSSCSARNSVCTCGS